MHHRAEREDRHARPPVPWCPRSPVSPWRSSVRPRPGTASTDRGDASGTGYWSPATGRYRTDILERAFGRAVATPRVLGPYEAAGETAEGVLVSAGSGDNMAAVHLASAVGGNVFLGFISAVAFATILAVVAGLTLSGASAVSHDLYATVLKKGKPAPGSELRVSKFTTIVLGVILWAGMRGVFAQAARAPRLLRPKPISPDWKGAG